MIRGKLTAVLATSALATGFATVPAVSASAQLPAPFTCSGGSFNNPNVVPAGNYSSVTVTGFCMPGAGTITAQSLTVTQGAAFAQFFSTSTLTITGNVRVGDHGVFFIGCGTSALNDATCADNASATTTDSIGGTLVGSDALLLVVHFTSIGAVSVSGGGGGLSCNGLPALGTPPFVDFDYDGIVGNARVVRLRTCWAGFADTSVGGSLTYAYNVTGDPDGNFVGNNNIGGNLACFADSPTPHLSDFSAVANTVGGNTTGQCVGET